MNHDTGSHHPESPMRIHYVHTLFAPREDPLLRLIEPVRASVDDVLLNHGRRHIDRIARASSAGTLVDLDPDTVCCPESYDTALLAAGSLVELVRMALGREIDTGFASVRPPGHHARTDEAMGFCLFNNVAIAARKAIACFGARKVAIIDFDVHHGNGTQESFYSDSSVLYFSTHQYPFYPGTGHVSETGSGEGTGHTVNCPLRGGKGDGEYLAVYRFVLAPLLESYEPDLVIVSAGFDAHARDPIGGMRVTSRGFAAITAAIQEAAHAVGAPTVYALEGGYNLGALKESVSCMVEVLKGAPGPEIEPATFPELDVIIREHARMWPLL
ncbi:MAG TPA: histone deacetylase [Deltaproteobacteria bacterium]|nr:histone deacetylase [Deltaproteobacteria bacterium]